MLSTSDRRRTRYHIVANQLSAPAQGYGRSLGTRYNAEPSRASAEMTARPPRGPQTGRLTVRKLIICAAAALMSATAVPAQAETPRDTLVMAWPFDDLTPLAPAAIFQFNTPEF